MGFLLLSLGRDKDKLAEDEVPGGGAAQARGIPIRAVGAGVQAAGERQKGREKNNRPFLFPPRPREGTERVCLSGENREKQASGLVERGGAGRDGSSCWALPGCRRLSSALEPRKQGERASCLYIYSSSVKEKTPLLFCGSPPEGSFPSLPFLPVCFLKG